MVFLIWKTLQRSSPERWSPSLVFGCYLSTLQTISENPYVSSPQEPLATKILMESCGLPSKLAQSLSLKLKSVKSDSIISAVEFLKSQGLTKSMICKVVTLRPGYLNCDFSSNCKPNIELFESLGISASDLSKIVAKDPVPIMGDAKPIVYLFKSYGFSHKQIIKLTIKRPSLYQLKVCRNLQPKLDYFKGLGLSDKDISSMISSKPCVLERSLKSQIKPSIELLQRLFGSNYKLVKAITGYSRVLEANLGDMLETNISILINHGVAEANILKAFDFHPSPLLVKSERFKEVVSETLEMGFDPKHLIFLLAVRTLGIMTKSRWQTKMELYQSYGLSEEDVLSAFRKQPMCMIVSDGKIAKMMDFYVKRLNMNPLAFVGVPNLILLSLEKRVLPRCSVLQILLSKGIVLPDKIRLTTILTKTEISFERFFIDKHKDIAPEVVKAHQGKVKFEGFPVKVSE